MSQHETSQTILKKTQVLLVWRFGRLFMCHFIFYIRVFCLHVCLCTDAALTGNRGVGFPWPGVTASVVVLGKEPGSSGRGPSLYPTFLFLNFSSWQLELKHNWKRALMPKSHLHHCADQFVVLHDEAEAVLFSTCPVQWGHECQDTKNLQSASSSLKEQTAVRKGSGGSLSLT